MPRRNSPQVIQHLDDLSQIDVIVVDKRSGQRASAKKNRRNRHYEKQFIRNSLARQVPLVDSDPEAQEPQQPLGEGH
mgnify:FL=1